MQKPTPKARFLFTLANGGVAESSGVASSRRSKNVYWTHNDSDGNADLFAFDETGKDLGTYALQGVTARDWEDIALALIDDVPYIYVGDIGDNLEDQKSVRIYRFIEPKMSDPKVVATFDTITVAYPDGPQNSEALMVAPNGDIYLVTKDDLGVSGVYQLASPSKSGTYKLSKVSSLKIDGANTYSRMVTAGDISADGKQVVIRTYFSILLYEPKQLSDIGQTKPTSLPMPFERQGEAICFDEANDRLITTSEGAPCRVSEVTLR